MTKLYINGTVSSFLLPLTLFTLSILISLSHFIKFRKNKEKVLI